MEKSPISAPTINNMKKLVFIFFSLFFFIFIIFSCSTRTHHIEVNKIGTYPQTLIEPLPIKVGVYYGNDFGKFESTQKVEIVRKGEVFITFIDSIKMGKANIALFDYILPQVFKEVTLVQHFSEDSEDMKNVDLIIKPTIHKYSYKVSLIESSIFIIYEILFYSSSGEPIRPWLIEGNGSKPVKIEFISETSQVVELTQMAMREVAAKFITDFCNQEDIKKLFYSQCNQ
jgi:hypothetical protein